MKISYYQKLSLLARWYLPRKEAEEVLRDYREILGDAGEEGAEERFGSPRKVVLELTDRAQRLWWAGVFALMAFCVLLSLLWLGTRNLDGWFKVQVAAAIFGTVFSLFFFGMDEKTPMSKPLYAGILTAFLFTAGCLVLILFFLFHLDWIFALQGRAGATASRVLMGMIAVSIFLSLLGLVFSRIFDRRWRVLYILGLTVIVLCAAVFRILWSMDSPLDLTDFSVQLHLASQFALIFGIGLCAGGIGLC